MRVLWLRFLTEVNESAKNVDEELLSEPMIHKAVKLLEKYELTPDECYWYDKSIDSVRVERALMRESKKKGYAEGKKEGVEIGRS